MRAIIIATFCRNSYNKEKITGYRLLRLPDKESDTEWKMEISDVSEYQLSCVMINKQLNVVNATIKDGKIHGTDGQLSRYAKIDDKTKQLVSKSPLIVLKQLKSDDVTVGYLVTDFKGQVVRAGLSDVIKYAELNGIANGKLVQRESRKIVSPISGEYTVVDITPATKKKVTKPKIDDDPYKFKSITVDQFREQMDTAGYSYKINGKDIFNIDDRVKTLVIPEGITTIGPLKQTYDSGGNNKSSIEVIHIPKSVWCYNYGWIKELKNIKKIILDPDMTVLDMDEFNECGIDKIHKLPDNIEIIRWYNSREEDNSNCINNFNQFKKLRRLDYAYQNCKITNDIDFGNIEDLYNCFVGGESEHTIKIKPTIYNIQGCFSSGAYDVDFSDAKGLSRLGSNVLHHIKGITKIDLSGCIGMTHIDYNCIRALPDLEELILPPNIEYIAESSIAELPKLTKLELPQSIKSISSSVISDTGITELEVPSGLEYAQFFSQNLILKPQNTEYIQSRVYNDAYVEQIILNDTIKEFKRGSFMRSRVGMLNIPTSLEKIHTYAFMGLRGLAELDFSICKNLRYVGESAFEGSELNVIILSDAVETIGDNAFKNVKHLKWIYIPNTVKSLGKSIFRGAGVSEAQRFTVFTQPDSMIDKYCKRNSIKVEYVNSAEEAIELNEEAGVDERKLKKYRLLLSGDAQHSVLFNEPYIDKIDELYKLYLNTATKQPWEQMEKVELNTEKFTSIPISRVMKPEDIAFYTDTSGAYKNKNAFNSMVNYITHISENYNGLLTQEAFDYMRKNDYIKEDNESILCKVIYQGEVWTISEIPGNVDGEKFQIILITKGENIIYCTACNKYYECTIAKPINKEICKAEEVRGPIDKALKIGATYRHRYGGSNSDMPGYIEKEVMQAMEEQLILIGSKIIKKNAFGYGDGSSRVYLLSCLNQKIIKCEARCYDIDINEPMEIRQVKNITVQDVFSWSDIPEEDFNIIKESYFNNKKLGPIMQKIVYGDNYIEKIKRAKGAYDEPIACYEWELSKALNEAGVSKLEQLNTQGLNLIFDTPFFIKTRKKQVDLSKLQMSKKYEIENGRYELITYIYSSKRRGFSSKLIGYDYKYISIIKDTTLLKDVNTVECFIHNHHVEQVFKKLKLIYNPTATKSYIVDDIEIKLEDYEIIGKIKKYIASYSSDELSHDVALAINKATGIVYLIGGNYRSLFKPDEYSKVYKLFRFRNLNEAVMATDWIYNSEAILEYNDVKYDIDDALSYLVHMLCDGNPGHNSDDKLYQARKLVVEGYPNGYSLGTLSGAMFSLVAKQPNKSS